ncbi:Neuropeptide Y receptor [Stylophora pistillata]|uniref:Neuropeptide Y receptor n=1 Tax=Stylophora pistillata TaxID=50429 RepID=A0A2B4RFH8_STYPI|nr:Neuropeptide Y receptor [Stylophora pistillata]
MTEYCFRQPKTFEDEEKCVVNAVPKSMQYKNKWAARIFEEWAKARFLKVATLEPGGLFKEYDLHRVQSLETPLFQMDALSVNYWLTKFVQEVDKPSKERYPPKTLYQIVCGLRRFMEEKNEKMDFNPVDASDKRESVTSVSYSRLPRSYDQDTKQETSRSLVLITVDRFVAVVFPLRCPFISSKQCRFFILATWIIAMAGWCPDLFAWKVVEYPERLACEHDWNDAFRGSSSFRNYLMTIIVVMYYVPLILVAILYFSIDIKIKSQKNPGEQSTNARERRLKREKNVLKLSIAIVLGFALCWLPFSILWFMLLNSDRTILTSCGFNYFSSVAELLALSNCAINPWICVCFVGNYRQGLKNLFCRSSVGTKVNQVTPY